MLEKLIPEKVVYILTKLSDNGYEAYLIGGASRTIVMERNFHCEDKSEIKDFDIVTSATPDEICALFSDKNTVTCGNSFLVSLVDDIEVATYRTDKADEAEVAHTLKEDMARRDFTINAIAIDIIEGVVIDHNQGVLDADSLTLRFIGEPEKRIIEDPVRILRGLRFAAQYNLDIENETYFAMIKYREKLRHIPRERVTLEIEKAFKIDNTYRFLTLLQEMDILTKVFPSLIYLENTDGGKYHNETILNHCLYAVKAIDHTKNVKLKLSTLYHDIGKMKSGINSVGETTFIGHESYEFTPRLIEQDLGEFLKFPNDTLDYVKFMIRNHMADIDTKKQIKKLCVKLTEAGISFKEFMYLRYADKKGNMLRTTHFSDTRKKYKEYLKIVKEKTPFTIKSLAITGRDIMQTFDIATGPEIGRILNRVHKAVLDELIPNDTTNILEYIRAEF